MTLVRGGQILITGGSGTIGRYIIDSLKDEFDIVVLDQSEPVDDVRFVKNDLRYPFSLSNDFELCIHLAALVGGIQFFTKHPVENMRDNPKLTANLLDACVNSKVQQVIYTSSSVVYEHSTQFPTPEEAIYSFPPPTSPYGMSKLVGEYLCKAYNQQYDLRYTILRLFNVYGPKEGTDPEYAHVIPQLSRKVLCGQFPVEIYGSGEQTRTFTHGKDVAAAYLMAIRNRNASSNQAFNVAGGQETRILDLLKLIWRITGHKEENLKVRNLPAFPHDAGRRFPSTEKIYRTLGWKPVISLADGLLETINQIKKTI
jgi:UDP-glucose 4-epimerase